MQSAEHSVHRSAQLFLHPADDVDDPPVGAGVEQHQAPAALQHQGVLMGEVIWDKSARLLLTQQVRLPAGKGAAMDRLGYQPRPVKELEQPLRRLKPVPLALPQLPTDPNEPGLPHRGGEIGPAGRGAGVYLRVVVAGKEAAQAAGVVIMSVGQHRRVHLSQVHPQGGGVVGEAARGARVQQDRLPPVLHIKGQPVLRRQTGALRRSVLNQNDDLHDSSSYSSMALI